eukprot:2648074-Pleurochrysis_carterae.AAC.1
MREAVRTREGIGVTTMTAGISKDAYTLARVASAEGRCSLLKEAGMERRQSSVRGSLTTKQRIAYIGGDTIAEGPLHKVRRRCWRRVKKATRHHNDRFIRSVSASRTKSLVFALPGFDELDASVGGGSRASRGTG